MNSNFHTTKIKRATRKDCHGAYNDLDDWRKRANNKPLRVTRSKATNKYYGVQ